ncbi:hypothetical protein AJ80_09280 [Polytolypa hystricis UAMH7299]|uniref:MARVEL domain-containing protein n=1 Tax=Polytolypa hystricis (strain UAMH7299) TaxID=1447883 RepID=A0A2B7WTD1_POLH7|nr:hypothetical protein AJ80_09280 [Polytolypa hystricis UAMH7299]
MGLLSKINIKGLVLDGMRQKYGPRSVVSTFIEIPVRFLQFVFGIAVIGLYAQDLDRARKAGKPMDSKWAYATVVGTLSSISALIYLILPFALPRPLTLLVRLHLPAFIHDTILSILFLTLFGIFGKMYIPEDDEKNKDVKRMKHAVWVVLACLAFWVGTMALNGVRWWKNRRGGDGGNADEGQFEKNQHQHHDEGEMREAA